MKKRLFKLLKIFFISIAVIVIFLVAILYFSLHKKMPEGTSGDEADTFAMQIQKAVHHDQFVNTDYIQWSFRNKNHYVWNKKEGKVTVKWDTYEANLDLQNANNSTVTENGVSLESNEKKKLLAKALAYFNNDSFWVVAPHKLFDDGVTRKIVNLEDGNKGLLVTYSSGGTTPGDSYLWKVDKNYLPTSYQMWVSLIPIGGIEASWENWKTTESGAYLSQHHKALGIGIPISNLRAWNE
ncbi:hypothetical protein [Aquimarina litoralis]|uniref:hypothetical protein n=1 Tax=Aquimarina litoralis TaxID=584605 RepID=UPI001C55B07D|nr:hypothetical protein [Aquimarina litoralis]MBW1298711.1 hypothetical protein [Aquimarina litoralis]